MRSPFGLFIKETADFLKIGTPLPLLVAQKFTQDDSINVALDDQLVLYLNVRDTDVTSDNICWRPEVALIMGAIRGPSENKGCAACSPTSLASEGSCSRRLQRVQKLAKDPSAAEIAELAVFLAAPENALRWLAGATLSQVGGPQVEAAVRALLEKEIGAEAREEAEKVLDNLRE
jgi:hypothetical protein